MEKTLQQVSADIQSGLNDHIAAAKAAGMTAVVAAAQAKIAMAQKLAVAMEHYRYVTQDDVTCFQNDLRKRTQTGGKVYSQYDTLAFTALDQWTEMPPREVLAAIQTAQERKCFDALEVAHIVSVREVIDPIVFGRINGSTDRFYVSQWGEDVKIEDILKGSDGQGGR